MGFSHLPLPPLQRLSWRPATHVAQDSSSLSGLGDRKKNKWFATTASRSNRHCSIPHSVEDNPSSYAPLLRNENTSSMHVHTWGDHCPKTNCLPQHRRRPRAPLAATLVLHPCSSSPSIPSQQTRGVPAAKDGLGCLPKFVRWQQHPSLHHPCAPPKSTIASSLRRTHRHFHQDATFAAWSTGMPRFSKHWRTSSLTHRPSPGPSGLLAASGWRQETRRLPETTGVWPSSSRLCPNPTPPPAQETSTKRHPSSDRSCLCTASQSPRASRTSWLRYSKQNWRNPHKKIPWQAHQSRRRHQPSARTALQSTDQKRRPNRPQSFPGFGTTL